MTNKVQVELYLAVDGNGNYGFGTDPDEAASNHGDNNGYPENGGLRVFCVVLNVPAPVVSTIRADIPETDDQPVTVTVG